MSTTLTKPSQSGLRSWFAGNAFPTLHQEMEDLLSRFGLQTDWPKLETSRELVPALDLSETETAVDVKLDVPGFKPEDIDIQIRGDVLTISGTRKEEKEEKGRAYHRVERRSGSFSRSILLPCEVNQKDAKADYKGGVLSLTIPKVEPVKTHKVAVNGAS